MTPYYADDLVTIYHGDCREVAPSLGESFAVVSDPPYGMRWDGRIASGPGTSGTVGYRASTYGMTVTGDDEPFDPSPWLAYPEVILWGANHYAQRLPVGTTLVWVVYLMQPDRLPCGHDPRTGCPQRASGQLSTRRRVVEGPGWRQKANPRPGGSASQNAGRCSPSTRGSFSAWGPSK